MESVVVANMKHNKISIWWKNLKLKRFLPLRTKIKNNWRKIINTTGKRRYILFLVSLLPIFILGWSGYSIFEEFILGANSSFGFHELEKYGVAQLTAEEPVSIRIDFSLDENSTNNNPQISYNISSGTVYRPSPSEGAKLICLNNIFIGTGEMRISSFSDVIGFEEQITYSFQEPLCGEPTEQDLPEGSFSLNSQPSQPNEHRSLYVFDIDSKRFFPFDSWRANPAYLWTDITDANGNALNITPRILGRTSFPGWKAKVSTEPARISFNGDVYEGHSFRVDLQRPLSTRIMSVVLLLALLGFITLLLFIEENSSTLEVGVGILLGLWGVQEILVPSSITETTLIHSLIQLLYVYFAVIVCLRFISKPLFKQIRTTR